MVLLYPMKKKDLKRDRKFISEAEHKRHRRKTKGRTYVKHKGVNMAKKKIIKKKKK